MKVVSMQLLLLLNIFILFSTFSLSQNLKDKQYLHSKKVNGLKTVTVNFNIDTSLQKDNSIIYDNYFSVSAGLSTYRPIYYTAYEGNLYFHLNQGIYLMTGLIYLDNIKYSSPDITIQYDLFANLYLLRKWQFNKVFAIWGGGGVSPSFGYSSANLFLKFDVAVSNASNVGLYIKQQFLITKKAPEYLRSPFILIHYSIKL